MILLEQAILMLPLILGAYILYSLMRVPDLSLESGYLFGAIVAAKLSHLGLPGPVLALVALGGGMIPPLLTATLNQWCKIPYLLASILVNGLFHGVSLFVLATPLVSIASEVSLIQVLFISGGALVLIGLLFRTQLGMSLSVFGNNPLFFSYHKISTRFVVLAGGSIAGSLAGLSGFLFAQANGFVEMQMGYGIVLMSITALVLGRLGFRGAKPSMGAPLLGVILFFLVQHLLLRIGLDLKYFNFFQAAVVLGVVTFNLRKKATRQIALDHLGV